MITLCDTSVGVLLNQYTLHDMPSLLHFSITASIRESGFGASVPAASLEGCGLRRAFQLKPSLADFFGDSNFWGETIGTGGFVLGEGLSCLDEVFDSSSARREVNNLF